MAVLKCKMCGDNIEVSSEKTYGTCESCGSTMTLPKIDDDQKVNLYNRANHIRRQNEFDKALAIYEKIIHQDDNEAEAHWGAVLCRFGIEYVEDPATHARIPTCHRASYDSILQDVDYLATLKYSADAVTKGIYEKEATYIAGVQKDIISISQKEKPCDVFICYKETDANGSRTQDSALAQDVYYQLTNEGFKVFFSRITLEDNLGQAYEPYIFAALNSAKVMVIIGTQPEHYNAVWVKNEWSRYLNLLKKDKSRLLIPCYRGMDAYDLPEALSMLQSQDMGKIGFVQDLIRGVKKVLAKEEAPVVKVVETVRTEGASSGNVEALLRRGYLFLEDKDWDEAKTYFNRALDSNPECAEAYIGLVCMSNRLPTMECLGEIGFEIIAHESVYSNSVATRRICYLMEQPITHHTISRYKNTPNVDYDIVFQHNKNRNCNIGDSLISLLNTKEELTAFLRLEGQVLREDKNYKKALKFASPKFRKKLVELENNVERRKTDAYYEMLERKRNHTDESQTFLELEQAYQAFGDYSNAPALAKWCREQYLEHAYQAAMNEKEIAKTAEDYTAVIKYFEELDDYKDVKAQIDNCYMQINEGIYQQAIQLKASGGYTYAITKFQSILDYQDAKTQIEDCERIQQELEQQRDESRAKTAAEATLAEKKRKKRNIILAFASGLIVICIVVYVLILAPMVNYNKALALLEEDSYEEARTAFVELGDYKDSADQIQLTYYTEATALVEQGRYDEARTAFAALGDYKDSADMAQKVLYVKAMDLFEQDLYEEASIVFSELGDYQDSPKQAENCTEKIKLSYYQEAIKLQASGNYTEALEIFTDLGDYQGSPEQAENCTEKIKLSYYQEAIKLQASGNYTEALEIFTDLGDYQDSPELAKNCTEEINLSYYQEAIVLQASGDYTKALEIFTELGDYADSQSKYLELLSLYMTEKRETISGGDCYAVGLKTDGTVVAVGSNLFGQCDVLQWSDIVSISAGREHTVGLKSNGTVVAVGFNESGQCNMSEWTDIVAISAQGSYTIGLKSDGTVVAVGFNGSNQCNVSEWTDIVSISASSLHAVGLKSDGTVVAVSYDLGTLTEMMDEGQCNVSDLSGIVAISVSSFHTVALKFDGTVEVVGSSGSERCNVSDWTDIVAISAGLVHTVGLKADGTVVAVGQNDDGQCDVGDWTDIVAISAGSSYTLGLKSDGTVVATGSNDYGQCDVSDWTDIKLPTT